MSQIDNKRTTMTVDELILKAIDKCLENANPEQRRIYKWMKAVMLKPDFNELQKQLEKAKNGIDKIDFEALDKGMDALKPQIDYIIESQNIPEQEKKRLLNNAEISFDAFKIQLRATLSSMGWLR